MSLPRPRWPAREAVSDETPSMRSPSETKAQVRWFTHPSPKTELRCASAIAIPTAVPKPCPSGPVVISMPRSSSYSGCPAVGDPHWRKLTRFSMVTGKPHSMQHRVQQHRTVPVRQYEAVPVRPPWMLGVHHQVAAPQNRGQVGHSHRHPRMTGVGPLDRVHGQRTDGVGGQVVTIRIDRRRDRHDHPPAASDWSMAPATSGDTPPLIRCTTVPEPSTRT